jgi:hypothetical protein
VAPGRSVQQGGWRSLHLHKLSFREKVSAVRPRADCIADPMNQRRTE